MSAKECPGCGLSGALELVREIKEKGNGENIYKKSVCRHCGYIEEIGLKPH